jgi:hypothetical protein
MHCTVWYDTFACIIAIGIYTTLLYTCAYVTIHRTTYSLYMCRAKWLAPLRFSFFCSSRRLWSITSHAPPPS